MMDEALKTHKETTFGWVLVLQRWLSAREQASPRPSRRYLAPR